MVINHRQQSLLGPMMCAEFPLLSCPGDFALKLPIQKDFFLQ